MTMHAQQENNFLKGSNQVNQNTGKAVYNLPIHTINELGISVPIYLQNNMGGIKIDDLGTDVGTGWSKSAGATITRVQQGFWHDERNNNGPLIVDQDKFGNYEYYYHNTVGYLEHFSNATYTDNYFRYGTIDTEPDIFYYNVEGFSGSFIIKSGENQTFQIEFLEVTNLKIQYNIKTNLGVPDKDSDDFNHIIGWEIITPNGNQYILGAFESGSFNKLNTEYTTLNKNLVMYEDGSNSSKEFEYYYEFATKWYTTKIVNQDNQIDFSYENESSLYSGIQNNYHVFNANYNIHTEDSNSFTHRYIRSKRVSSIESKYSYIEFSYDLQRKNISSANPFPELLDIIEISTKNNSEFNCVVKYNFEYDHSYDKENLYYHKYFLNTISKSNCDNSEELKVSFLYHDIELAKKVHRYGQDLWGYSNGVETNEDLFYIPEYSGDCVSFYAGNNYNNRELSFSHARAGTLKEVKNPNGSKEHFDFEFNSIYNIGADKENKVQQFFKVNSLKNNTSCPESDFEIPDFNMDDQYEYQLIVKRNYSCNELLKLNNKPIEVYNEINNQLYYIGSFNRTLQSKSSIRNILGLEYNTDYHLHFRTTYDDVFPVDKYGNYDVIYNQYPLIFKNWDVGGLRIKNQRINEINTEYTYEFPIEGNSPSEQMFELNICEACPTKADTETCDKNDDISTYTFVDCNTLVTAELFLGGVNNCSTSNSGHAELIFSDKSQVNKFSIPLLISDTNNSFSFSDSELISYGLTKGVFYRVILKANTTDDAKVYIRSRITFENIEIPYENLASSGVQLVGPVNIGVYNELWDELIDNQCPSGDYYFLNTNANNFFQTGGNSEVVYKKVEAAINKGLGGSTISFFDVHESLINTYLIKNYFNPTIPLISTRRPKSHMFLPRDFTLMKKVESYNANNDLISLDEYEYFSPNKKHTLFSLNYYQHCSAPFDVDWHDVEYDIYVFDSKLKSVSHSEDGITQISEYSYLENLHTGYKSIKSYNKAFPSEYNIQEITYSTELPEYNFLTERNYILPIVTSNNGGLGGGSKMKYGLINDKVRLLENYAYDSDGTDEATKWIKTSENISFTDEGLVTESWSKKDPINSFFFYNKGLLNKTQYGTRETRFFYDDLRRKRLTLDPTGIGTYIATFDGFHRPLVTKTGVVSDFSNIENVLFSHIKSESNHSYIIDVDADEEIRQDISFPSDNYGLGTHSSTTYLDNYGRNYKNILHEFTQSQQDYESKNLYNALGIQTNQCSPGSGGCSFSVFEKSPRSRLEKTRAPGASKFVEYKYGNEVPDIDGLSGYYVKSSVQDENGNISSSYANITGRKKIVIDALNQRTTYLYNDRGQLSSVTTAGGTEYSYNYDGFGRLESKTIPLKGTYTYAYDVHENLTSEILPNTKTLHYNYHPTYNDFLLSVQDENNLDLQKYSPYNNDFHTSWVGTESIKVLDKNKTLLSSFVYDDYGRVTSTDQNFYDGASSSYTFGYDDLDNLRFSTRLHTPNTGTAYEISTRYEYDRGRRLEEVYKTLPEINEEFLVSRHQYDDRDWQVYKNQGGLYAEVYQYNTRGWLKSINSIEQSYPPQISPCDETEDDVACTTKKPPNSGIPIYEQDQPNSDLFSMNLYYSQGNTKLQAPAQHNGNIAWTEWRVKGENIQKYGFQYDPINRLEQAKYTAFDRLNCEVLNKGAYNVNIDEYDAMGNIGKIRRNGLIQYNSEGEPEYGLIDDLTLDYENGYLSDVTENSLTDKGYQELGDGTGIGIDHEVGNMVNSTKQGIDLIEYNFLDLPTHVEMSTGIILDFVYDALGNQLQMTKSQNNTTVITDYFNGIEYVNGGLESIYFEEGRAVYNQNLAGTNNNPYLEWVINDHLGNVRVRYVDKNNDGVISVNQGDDITNEIIGSYHYYPFGMKMDGAWNVQQGNRNKYQYNGIEHLDDVGLSFATFRIHDPALGRWLQIDPLAEALYSYSPFNAMGNNPISYADKHGDFIPQLVGGIVGGLVNLGSQALQGNVTSFGEGLAYFGVGAVSGALVMTPGMMGAARLVQVAGNKTVQIATGKLTLDDVDSAGEIGILALDVALDATVPGLTKAVSTPISKAVVAKLAVNALGEATVSGGTVIVREATEELAYTFADDFVVTAQRTLPARELAAKLVNTVPRTRDVTGHIFRNATGHVNPTTIASQNRYLNLFEKVANNINNLNPTILNTQAAQNGVQAYTQTFRNGQQVWVHARHGRIFDAGVNLIPR